MTSTWTFVFTLVAKLSETPEGDIRAHHPPVGPVLTAHHYAAWLVFAREHAVSALFSLPDKHMWQIQTVSPVFLWRYCQKCSRSGHLAMTLEGCTDLQGLLKVAGWDLPAIVRQNACATDSHNAKGAEWCLSPGLGRERPGDNLVSRQNHTQMFSGVHTATFPNGGSEFQLSLFLKVVMQTFFSLFFKCFK